LEVCVRQPGARRATIMGPASANLHKTGKAQCEHMFSALPLILLQKSKVASVRIFGETLKHEAIDDSDNLSRATEVAYEFSVRG
jgi:hypothetical protein